MIKKQLQRNSKIAIVAALFCTFLLPACKSEQSAPSVPFAPQASKANPKPIQKKVSSSSVHLAPPPVNQFDFSNKKDPFKPFMAVKTEVNKIPVSTKTVLHNSLPIHSFDVSQFKLIGIITGGRENQAMVTDPGGKGYVLKMGMTIGKNDGRIVSINSNGVDVLEQFRDDNGRIRKENIKLALPRKQ